MYPAQFLFLHFKQASQLNIWFIVSLTTFSRNLDCEKTVSENGMEKRFRKTYEINKDNFLSTQLRIARIANKPYPHDTFWAIFSTCKVARNHTHIPERKRKKKRQSKIHIMKTWQKEVAKGMLPWGHRTNTTTTHHAFLKTCYTDNIVHMITCLPVLGKSDNSFSHTDAPHYSTLWIIRYNRNSQLHGELERNSNCELRQVREILQITSLWLLSTVTSFEHVWKWFWNNENCFLYF